jgi:hypothetical protein
MPIIINGNQYRDNTRFRIAVDPEFKALSGIDKNLDKRDISYMPVNFLQHGYTLIADGKEEKIESIFVEPIETRTPFYHMHIYKTSGLSTKMDIIDMFFNRQVYANFIGLIDREQMLTSSFITGHFASYPIELFKKYNKNLHSFTIVREPIERAVSHYLYESRVSNNESSHSIDGFINFIENNLSIMTDLQTKNMTSTLDVIGANHNAQRTLHEDITLHNSFLHLGSTSRFLNNDTNEDKWIDHIEKFSLIGTVEEKAKFSSALINLLEKEGYSQGRYLENNINKNFVSTKDFIKKLPNDVIGIIEDISKNDIAMYDYIKSMGVYNGE